MIYDSLDNFDQYSSVIPSFDFVKEFLKGDLSSLPLGRHAIDGENIYASVDCYETKCIDGALFENHDRYIDIQIVLSGEELCGISTGKLAEAVPYDEKRDIRFFEPSDEASSAIVLRNGLFAVFFHDDAHMPGLVIDEKGEVCKVVIKVLKK